MKINTEKLLYILRANVVAGSLLALVVCGGSAIGRQVAVAPGSAGETAVSAKVVTADPVPDDAEGPGRQMETDAPGRTGTAAFYMSGVLAKTGNDDSRFRRGEPVTTPHLVRPNACPPKISATSTSARVSSSLGRQFTLVGAKPSGTS